MADLMLRVLGWRALLITGDPCVLDRWLWLRKHLRKGPSRTFDAGSGNGAFSIYAALAGNTVVAASFSDAEQARGRARAAAVGARDVDFRTLDLRELDRHRGSLGDFDQIICLETIEHVADDRRLVHSLVGMLRPGGQLLMSTPFDGHRPLYSEQRHPSAVEDGSHVRFGYSRQQLRGLAADAGLHVADEAFISGVVSQKLTNLLRRLTRAVGLPLAWAVVLPLRALVCVDWPLSRLLGYPYLSVAVCAVKPA